MAHIPENSIASILISLDCRGYIVIAFIIICTNIHDITKSGTKLISNLAHDSLGICRILTKAYDHRFISKLSYLRINLSISSCWIQNSFSSRNRNIIAIKNNYIINLIFIKNNENSII